MKKSGRTIKISLICAALAVLFSGMTARAQENADENLEGTWEFTMTMGDMGMEIRSEAVFTKDTNDTFTGTWETRFEMPEGMQQPAGEFQMPQFKLSDIKLDGRQLTFTQTMEGGQMGNMESNFSGTIDGDKIEGTMSSQFGETPITGVRMKKDIVGDWIFKVNLGETVMGGPSELTVNSTITKDANGIYAMTWEQEESGQAGMQAEIRNEDIKLEDDELTFLHIVSMGDMGEFQMNFSGTYEGDKISGTLASDMMGNIAVTAERKVVDALSGEWEFTMTFGDMGMEMKSKAVFTKSDDGYSATWESIPQEGMPAMEAEVTLENIKLEDDKLSFTQKVTMGEMGEFQSDFSGTLEADTITGQLTSQMGTMPLNAVRIK